MNLTPAPVSVEVFERIVDAIQEISDSETLKRTKRQIENLSGLSHATVARAFAQDLREPNDYAITERFAALQSVLGTRSVAEDAERTKDEELEARRTRIKQLEDERAQHLQMIYALWLASQSNEPASPIVRIKRPRSPYRQ